MRILKLLGLMKIHMIIGSGSSFEYKGKLHSVGFLYPHRTLVKLIGHVMTVDTPLIFLGFPSKSWSGNARIISFSEFYTDKIQ